MRVSGPGVASGVVGHFWGDIIGSGSWGPRSMVSERVMQGLLALGGGGFTAHPVKIESVRSWRLLLRPRPKYFYLSITGQMKIDGALSGIGDLCEACGRLLRPQINTPQRLIPVEGTWDGSDLFHGFPYGGPFCTERVLLLAREQRWTNFCFHPTDEVDARETGPGGIDYLAERWPPEGYPLHRSKGKTLDQWLEQYDCEPRTDEEFKQFYAAERALEELWRQAVPVLAERQRRGSKRAAQALLALSRRSIPIPPDVVAEARRRI